MIRALIRPLRVSATAGLALLGSVALVSAQQMQDKGREPSLRDKGSEGKALREPPGSRRQQSGAERSDKDGAKGAERSGKDHSKSAERPDQKRAKGAERSDQERAKGAERSDQERAKGAERSDQERAKGAERSDQKRAKGAERSDQERAKGAERSDQERAKGAERSDQERAKGAERSDQERAKGAERRDRTGPSTAQPGTETGAPGRARLTEQQRSDIGAKLRQTRVEKTRVHVDVNIGSRVPRSVHLRPLPSAIVASVPAYRGYSYFVREDNTIVIVDTGTHTVVDVIPAATRAAGLSLTPEQMRFIYARVPKDRTANVRVRLALGVEVPRRVELLAFPAEVRKRIPKVAGYRYIVAQRDVVIVDPRDRDVALVISE